MKGQRRLHPSYCSDTFVASVSACLICRFILNLRGVGAVNTYDGDHSMTTIDFMGRLSEPNVMATIVGNMGGSLQVNDDENIQKIERFGELRADLWRPQDHDVPVMA